MTKLLQHEEPRSRGFSTCKLWNDSHSYSMRVHCTSDRAGRRPAERLAREPSRLRARQGASRAGAARHRRAPEGLCRPGGRNSIQPPRLDVPLWGEPAKGESSRDSGAPAPARLTGGKAPGPGALGQSGFEGSPVQGPVIPTRPAWTRGYERRRKRFARARARGRRDTGTLVPEAFVGRPAR